MNSIEHTIVFSYETKTNNTLNFLDHMFNGTNNDQKLNVYQKPINKNDLINFYIPNNNKINPE